MCINCCFQKSPLTIFRHLVSDPVVIFTCHILTIIVYNVDAPSEESRRFRLELLRRVQQELTSTAEQLSGPVQQQLLQQVASIIRRCEEDLLNSFDATNLAVPVLSYRRASDTSTLSTVSGQHTPQNPTLMNGNLGPPGSTARLQYPVPDTTYADSFTWPEEPSHQRVALEQQGRFRSVMWDQPQSLDPIAEWIDIDAMIPPTINACGNGHYEDFSVATWSQQQ